MGSILQITLGILTSIGGFVDVGELVFSVQSGVKFGFTLLWAVLVGTIGIIIFSESAGRIAAVTRKPVFQVIKERLPKWLSVIVLIASITLTVVTCAAEIGGVGVALQLLTGLSLNTCFILSALVLLTIMWFVPFSYLEKGFGLLGLLMLIFTVTIFAVHTPWHPILQGFIPQIPHYDFKSIMTYAYFAVGIISSSMMPYEVYFYSSGGIEEKWTPKSLLDNKLTSGIGMVLGATLSASLLILGSQVLKPLRITPDLVGTTALIPSIPFGQAGLLIALLGIMFTIAGAVIETSLAGAYITCQFFGWKWGKEKNAVEVPKFTLSWMGTIILGLFILLVAHDPVQLVEYAVIFSVVALPFVYYAITKESANKKHMGRQTTTGFFSILSWIYFVIISLVALVSIPLLIITNMGKS